MRYEISRPQAPNANADQRPEKKRKTIEVDRGGTAKDYPTIKLVSLFKTQVWEVDE